MVDKNWSRRDFLVAAGAAGVGALLNPSVAWAQEDASVVPTRTFGKTGEKVSTLGLGGTFDVRGNQLLLRQALKYGVTYWDTASGYGRGQSEEGFGRFFERNPEERGKVFLVSKASGATEPGDFSRSLDDSLRRLQTDHLDLYFMHGIADISAVNRPEIRDWADKAKKSGKIRFFGFSSHENMARCLAGAAPLGWIDAVMVTYNYRVMKQDDMKAALTACVEAGIGVTAMKTQGAQSDQGSDDDRALREHFKDREFTAEQARLFAVWENEQISSICSRIPNMRILKENVAASLGKNKLSAVDRDALERHASATCAGYCAGCTYRCLPEIGEDLPIHGVMRSLMYDRGYGDRELALSTFSSLSKEKLGRLAAVDLSRAETVCPQKLPITRLVAEALEIFGAA